MSENNSKIPQKACCKKMTSRFPTASKEEITDDVFLKIRKNAKDFDVIDYVYINDRDGFLEGVVSLKDMLENPKTKMESVMMKKPVSVSPLTDQEKAADLAVKHGIKAVPVVENKKIIGVIQAESILKILKRAFSEDLLHFAGIHKSHLNYENALEVPLLTGVFHRFPWLFIGLLGISFSAGIMNLFQSTLEKHLILVFFVPAIVYMSGALGAQNQTLLVRDLVLMGKKTDMKKYFLKQMLKGIILAFLISSVVFAIVSVFWAETFLALVIAISMFITLVVSSFNSMAITLFISKIKLDPAIGSGPIATMVSDLFSVIIYLVTAFILL